MKVQVTNVVLDGERATVTFAFGEQRVDVLVRCTLRHPVFGRGIDVTDLGVRAILNSCEGGQARRRFARQMVSLADGSGDPFPWDYGEFHPEKMAAAEAEREAEWRRNNPGRPYEKLGLINHIHGRAHQ